MNLKVSSVFDWTMDALRAGKHRQIVNDGGTRSGKSVAFLQIALIIVLTEKNIKITCWRNVRAVCRATIMEDFNDLLISDFSIYNKFIFNKHEGKFTCKLTGSSVRFEGCDSPAKVHGLKQDYAFFNEITEMKEEIYDQITQRTMKMVFADFNPSKKFWFDKYRNNPNTIWFKSTFLDNPFLPQGIINKILSYDPDNQDNVRNGTANRFMHEVYALGNQAEAPNRVYKTFARCTNKYYINLDYKEYYGLDFGTSNQTAVVGVKFDGERTFFVRQLLYKPSREFNCTTAEYLKKKLLMIEPEDLLVCDSAKLSMITDLVSGGFNAAPARKGPGSFDRGIATVQGFNIVVTVESMDLIDENSTYEYKLDRYGLKTDDVIRKNDHLCDSLRYCCTYLVGHLEIQV
jgi:PBSX family phage terminase large subunit